MAGRPDVDRLTPAWAADYAAIECRVAEVVSAGDCERAVPACPEWTVHDVVSHLAGLCQDWVHGRMERYASDGWTSDQVARFTGQKCPEVLEAWASAMVPFGRLTEPFLGAAPGRWAFGDAVIHEADLRGALGAGRVPHDDVVTALGLLVPRWDKEVLRPAERAGLEVTVPDAGVWVLGPAAGGPVVASVKVPVYELFRAMAGRRSVAQVRGWDWSVDPEPFVRAGLPYPFHWSSENLVD